MPEDDRFNEAFMGLWAQLSYLNQSYGTSVTGEALAEAFVLFVAEGFRKAKEHGKEIAFWEALNKGLSDAAQKAQNKGFAVEVVLGIKEVKPTF